MSATRQMKPLILPILLVSASLMAGCSVTGNASDGSGYSALKPTNSQTRTFIEKNDQPFWKDLAAHNLQCSKDKGCWK